MQRGTATPEGRTISGLIPTAPGSRASRDSGHLGPLEKKAFAVVAAARQIDQAIGRDTGLKAELAGGLEQWERQHRELVATARALEHALTRRGKLSEQLLQGFREYHHAVEQLPELDGRLAKIAKRA